MSDPADPDHQIATALGRLALYWRAQARDGHGPDALSPTQAEALASLARLGPLRPAQLAAALGVRPPSLSETLDALEARGLVARGPDPDDARARLVRLTAVGRDRMTARDAAPPALRSALAGLAPPDRAGLARALLGLIRGLQEGGAIPVQRMCLTCAHFRPRAHPDPTRPHHCAFVDAAFGDADLRADCRDHDPAPDPEGARTWARFAAGD